MSEATGHCWHETGHNIGEDREKFCCCCGEWYRPRLRITSPGHGKLSPDKMRPSSPKGSCKSRKAATQITGLPINQG